MSSRCDVGVEPAVGVGITFLKKMLEETKMTADPNAHRRPSGLEAISNEQESMTPIVNGRRDAYVVAEYLTPNNIAYAATVNRGDNA